jgi:hypothetical protein
LRSCRAWIGCGSPGYEAVPPNGRLERPKVLLSGPAPLSRTSLQLDGHRRLLVRGDGLHTLRCFPFLEVDHGGGRGSVLGRRLRGQMDEAARDYVPPRWPTR